MMICFRENIFWAKTSLSLRFRGPNSAHPKVFRCANCNCTSFKAVWGSITEKTHFGLKHHFPWIFRWPNSVHPEVFSCISQLQLVQVSKLVWWSVSEKTHFGLKHHFPLYIEGQTQHTLKLSGMTIAMVQFSKLNDNLFLRNHILG